MIAPAPCGSCGAMNPAGVTFCARCGARLAPPVAPPAQVVPAAAGPAPTWPGMQSPSPPPYVPAYGPGVGPGVPYAPPPGYGGYPPVYAQYPQAPERATAGAMITGTFGVWGKDALSHILLFLVSTGISVSLTLGVTLLALGAAIPTILGGGPPAGVALATFFVVVIAAAVLGVVISAIFVGTSAYIAVRRHQGQPVPLSEAFRHAAQRLPSLVGAALVQGGVPLLILIPPLTLLLVAAASLTPTDLSGIGLLLGACLLFVLLIPVALFVSVKFGLAVPSIVAEGKSAVDGLRHSWRLLAGRWWTFFAAAIVVGIVAAVVNAIAGAPAGAFPSPLIRAVGQIIGGAVTGSWSVILASVAYSLIKREQALPPPGVYATPIPYWQPGMPPPGAPPGR